MSNYSITTNFAAKDSLSTGNPAKVIKGTEFSTEFTNIAAAISSKVDSNGALGTPSSGILTNATGLPVSTGISGLGSNVANFLATPSSANLASAVTDETGTGSVVFSNSPTLVTPALGTPSSVVLTSATGLPLSTGVTGTLPVANGGTGITAFGAGIASFLGTPSSDNLRSALTDKTGTGSAVFSNSPTLVTPILGTPASATLTNATGLPLTTGITGTLPVTNGGTNLTSIGSANQVLAVNSGGTALEYRTLAGTGTVTSVDISGGTTGLTTSGGPVTSSGTMTLAGTLAVANGGTGATSLSAAGILTTAAAVTVAQGGTGATSLTANNVILGNGTSAVQVVAPGSSGNVLTSNGTTWTSAVPAGGGAWTFISSVTASNSATVQFDGSFNSTYDYYVIICPQFMPATDSVGLQLTVKVAGSWRTSSYYYSGQDFDSGGSTPVGSTGASFIPLTKTTAVRTAAGSSHWVCVSIYAPSYTGISMIYSNAATIGSGSTAISTNLRAGAQGTLSSLTGVRFELSSGNIASGTWRLYGVKNS